MKTPLTLLFCAALLGLGVSAAPQPTPRTLNFTVGRVGQDVPVQPGDLLRFSLTSMPGTGYTWRALEVDPAFLALVDKRTVSPKPVPGQAPLVGGPGPVITYTYKVVAPLKRGSASLTIPIYFAELPPGRAQSVQAQLVQFNLVPR